LTLLENPAQAARLRAEPALAKPGSEELLRHDARVQVLTVAPPSRRWQSGLAGEPVRRSGLMIYNVRAAGTGRAATGRLDT